MLIDLTPSYTRFDTGRHPKNLIVLIPEGRVRPVTPQQVRASLHPIYEEPGLRGFRLIPGGPPSYEDADAKGWEFNISMGSLGRHVQVVLRLETDGRWAVRSQGQLGAAFDVTLPDFQPEDESVVALGQEGLRWRILMANMSEDAGV